MTVDFETKCEQTALDYIKIHLQEGYLVTAYKDVGNYYWESVYKIRASLSTARKAENSSEKPNNCEDEPRGCDTCEYGKYGNTDNEEKCDNCSFGTTYNYEPIKDSFQTDAAEVAKDINRRVDLIKREWEVRHTETNVETMSCQECVWCPDGKETCANPNLCRYIPKTEQTERSE